MPSRNRNCHASGWKYQVGRPTLAVLTVPLTASSHSPAEAAIVARGARRRPRSCSGATTSSTA